ncbi:MAG: DUF934 domain-containing protein [Betaproteobacteria bacterium]|nr:DUF934 domain-containing protein [Betaproteobacteria bacterium]
MAVIIKDRQVVTDPWQRLELAPDGSLPAIPPAGDILAPLALWQVERNALLARPGRIGVWLDSHEDPAAIAEDLRHFGIVAVNFPKFGDGRGYSTAQLLRSRFFLSSCGFDAYALREGEDPQEALAAFGDFSEAYQASVERPVPLFRRRDRGVADGGRGS